jgi:hypothetical protein
MKSLSLFFQLGTVASLGIVTIGCGSSAQKPSQVMLDVKEVKITPQNQRSLFPITVGNSWVYTMEASAQSLKNPKKSMTGVLGYRVVKVLKVAPFAVRATIEVFLGGKKTDEQDWVMDDKGLFLVSTGAVKKAYSPRQPILKFPLKDQDNFKWEGTGSTPIGKPGKMTYAFKYDGMQNADTDMGQMNAAFMQSVGAFKTDGGEIGKMGVNSWYSPGVGLVRYKQEIELKGAATSITLRLKSYNVVK